MKTERSKIKNSVRFKWWQISHPVLSLATYTFCLILGFAICSFFIGPVATRQSGIDSILSLLETFVKIRAIWFIGACLGFVWILNHRNPIWKRHLEQAKQHDPELASQFEELAYRDGLIKGN